MNQLTKDVLERDLFNLSVLAKEGKYHEVWNRLYKDKSIMESLAIVNIGERAPGWNCARHNLPMTLVPRDPDIRCDSCEYEYFEYGNTPEEAA